MEPVRKAKETLGHHDAANTKNNGTDNSSKLSQYNLRDQKNNSRHPLHLSELRYPLTSVLYTKGQSRGRADTKLANRIDPQAAEEQSTSFFLFNSLFLSGFPCR